MRLDGGKAQAPHPRPLHDLPDQAWQAAAAFPIPPVRPYFASGEDHLSVTSSTPFLNLVQHFFGRAALFPAAGIGYYAEGAEAITALLNLYQGTGAALRATLRFLCLFVFQF